MTIKEKEFPKREFPIISEKEIKKKTEKKISPAAEAVFNIEMGVNRKVVPISATAYDLPIYAIPAKIAKSPAYHDAIIIDIRRKLKKARENIKNCNLNTMNDICKISNLVDIHIKYMYIDPSFEILKKDIMKTQQEFIDNCKITSSTKEELNQLKLISPVDKFKLSTKIIKKQIS